MTSTFSFIEPAALDSRAPEPGAPDAPRPADGLDGKFLRAAGRRFLIKGVAYGTFAPDARGRQFPLQAQSAADFAMMAALGFNTVRVYTPPDVALLDQAAAAGLRVMAGLPWTAHVAFLDDRTLRRQIRQDMAARMREIGSHPALLLSALGNEIPAAVVRWHGRRRVEHFLRELYDEAKQACPEGLFTYVNFPPTEYLELPFFDVCAFNVYLHRERDLRGYIARLQHIAGHKPLLLAEAGADSIRESEAGQAALTAMQLKAAFAEGACGAVAFSWTDEWWRGGHPVSDWAFGLVDHDRQAKPAAAAVADVVAGAPFSAAERNTWPRVSVIVCAYNAAETLEDCLGSLERLTYPDYEVILVNDGSRDRTNAIARNYPSVRLIEIPNGGLSAARNVGLAAATGDIVAYTDADVRVDQDWLTYLVQPFLTSDVVGSGGPNVVPADDAWVAQSVARGPGGPTHVLLDDRIAEHVPGCNMAFRRDALTAIGGFNPIYLRAGDDVDVCWRLQARGWKIGFAPSALVWHHHRPSIRAYWRQQVGYGEGEAWLLAHHPEKFLDGRMLWHGRIYSPLPFVRALSDTRINAGVWGTAPFPSVYHTGVHPFAFMPHSARWQALSLIMAIAGAVVLGLGGHRWAALLLLGAGVAGITATMAKCTAYALRSEIDSLPPIGRRSRRTSRVIYRTTIGWLHFLQPLARVRGRIRGVLSPPEIASPAPRQTTRRPAPAWRDAARAMHLLAGGVIEDQFWSERWTSGDRLLTRFTSWLRGSRAVRTIEVDDGWSSDRDVAVLVGRWSWMDIRTLVEEHAEGRCLVRLSTHLRPTAFGVVAALAIGASLLASASAGVALRWPTAGAVAAVATLLLLAVAVWRTAQTAAIVRLGIADLCTATGLQPMATARARVPLAGPSLLRSYALRSVLVFALGICAVGAGALMLREAASGEIVAGSAATGYAGDGGPAIAASLDTPGGIAIGARGDLFIADSHNDVIRHINAAGVITTVVGDHLTGFTGDNGLARRARLDTPDGVAIAPDGDLVVADSHNDRIRRIDSETHLITTVAGSGATGYDGDEKPATSAALNTPDAIAFGPHGDLFIADTMNNRIRMVDHATGEIHTVAGDGRTFGADGSIGDGGLAVNAELFEPSDVAVAPDGDIYIADMYHNRIRRVDARTGIISTVAGDGTFESGGDGGLAIRAGLAGPAGIALVPTGSGVTLFVADYYNGAVRMVTPDGIIKHVDTGDRVSFGAPARIAYSPRGWLYVSDATRDRVTAIPVPRLAPPVRTPAPHHATPVRHPKVARKVA
ncbi:MAG TPA: glycosyltransferase [Vicinamibacterales bacterium]